MSTGIPRDTVTHEATLPPRPRYGWQAWEATLGYIRSQHSPDVVMKITITPETEGEMWSAEVSWANHHESVTEQPSITQALDQLWQGIAQRHTIFKNEKAARKSPTNYAEDEWFDKRTATTLERVIRIIHSVFKMDWQLVIIYQPVSMPDARFQARLMARQKTVQIGGAGPSFHEVCKDFHHNVTATVIFSKQDK